MDTRRRCQSITKVAGSVLKLLSETIEIVEPVITVAPTIADAIVATVVNAIDLASEIACTVAKALNRSTDVVITTVPVWIIVAAVPLSRRDRRQAKQN